MSIDYTQGFHYLVDVQSSNASFGSVSGSGRYTSLDTATLVATPATNCIFVGWSDGVSSNPRTLSPTSDTSITANFQHNDIHITAISNNPSLGTVAGSGTYAYQSSVTITATPAPHCSFNGWDDGVTSATRVISALADTVITAFFQHDPVQITANSSDTLFGNVSGGGTFDYLDTVTLYAVPQPLCHLVQWSDGDTSNPRVMIALEDTSVTAHFAPDSMIFDLVVNGTAYHPSDSIHVCVNDTNSLKISTNYHMVDIQWYLLTVRSAVFGDSAICAYNNPGSYNISIRVSVQQPIAATYDFPFYVQAHQARSFFIDTAGCDSLYYHNVSYTASGQYTTFVGPDIYGCDSTEYLKLKIWPSYDMVDQIAIPDTGAYLWIDGNYYTAPNHTAEVVLQSIHGCDSVIHLWLDPIEDTTTSSINPTPTLRDYVIKPNPASREFSILRNEGAASPTVITIFDMHGRVLLSETMMQDEIIIDAANWPRGIYLIRLATAKEYTVKQLILQ